MKKGLLIIMKLMIILLSSCKLAEESEVDTSVTAYKHLIGFYAQLYDFSQLDMVPLLPVYEDTKAIYQLNNVTLIDGIPVVHEFHGHGFVDATQHTHLHEEDINGIKVLTFTQASEMTILFGPNALGKVVYLNPIYDDGKDPAENGMTGHMLSRGATVTMTFKEEHRDPNYAYQNSYKVTIKVIDELTSVNIIEMSKTHNVIKTTTITEPLSNYQVQSDTAYVILEENFLDFKNDPYTTRYIFDQQSMFYKQLYFTNDTGLVVSSAIIQFIFQN